MPPRPPLSRGSPAATSSRNRPTASAPRRQPSSEPVIITPRVCKVIGTVLPNRYRLGARPSAAMSAANDATSARSLAVNRRACVMRGILAYGQGPGFGRSLQGRGREGVAVVKAAALVAAGEPALSLGRRTVG